MISAQATRKNKMKLSEFIKVSHSSSTKASDITRQMILAGIGIIWFFKDKDTNTLQKFIILPLLTLGLALLLDLLQYFLRGIMFKSFYDKNISRHRGADPELAVPDKLSKPLYAIYYGKICLMLVSYILIVIFLFHNLHFK